MHRLSCFLHFHSPPLHASSFWLEVWFSSFGKQDAAAHAHEHSLIAEYKSMHTHSFHDTWQCAITSCIHICLSKNILRIASLPSKLQMSCSTKRMESRMTFGELTDAQCPWSGPCHKQALLSLETRRTQQDPWTKTEATSIKSEETLTDVLCSSS